MSKLGPVIDPNTGSPRSLGAFVHFNVNEAGEPYARVPSMATALRTLEEFPNDHIVTVYAGSVMDEKLSAELI